MRYFYAQMPAAEWLRELGLEVSPLGERVAQVLGYVGSGIYNAPINPKKIDWADDFCIRVHWRGSLATWDGCQLTALVVVSNRFMLRVDLSPSTPRGVELMFHRRATRDPKSPGAYRLPTVEQIIEMIDLHFVGNSPQEAG